MIVSAQPFKVYLKSLELDDAESIARHANDYELFSNISPDKTFPYPFQLSDAMELVEQSSNAFLDGVMFNFGVVIAGTTDLIGVCGIKNIDHSKRRCEIGYWIGREHWGKGYGKDAVRLLTHMAFEDLDINEVNATVMAFNLRSIKLLESLGFKKHSTGKGVMSKGKRVDTVVYVLNKSVHRKINAQIKNWD